jgi:hypothetical protein
MEPVFVQGQKMSVPPANDELLRKLCFEMFNAYWQDANDKGVPFDTIGTMSISAALFALVAKHGTETTAEFLQDLVKSVQEDKFTSIRKDN